MLLLASLVHKRGLAHIIYSSPLDFQAPSALRTVNDTEKGEMQRKDRREGKCRFPFTKIETL